MQFDIITIFPHIFDSYLNESILKRAQKKDLIKINIHNLRDYTKDKHKTVDDRPYGGGPGMIMMIEPIYRALQALKVRSQPRNTTGQESEVRSLKKEKTILLTPTGKTFNQKMARKFSKLDRLIFICGRYEGIDARVEKLADEKISIGDYVLSGGELPAMILVETISRLIPSVLGHKEATIEETFAHEGYVEYPQYSRPEKFCPTKKTCWRVPKVLLSGNHKKIKEWREKQSKIRKR